MEGRVYKDRSKRTVALKGAQLRARAVDAEDLGFLVQMAKKIARAKDQHEASLGTAYALCGLKSSLIF